MGRAGGEREERERAGAGASDGGGETELQSSAPQQIVTLYTQWHQLSLPAQIAHPAAGQIANRLPQFRPAHGPSAPAALGEVTTEEERGAPRVGEGPNVSRGAGRNYSPPHNG